MKPKIAFVFVLSLLLAVATAQSISIPVTERLNCPELDGEPLIIKVTDSGAVVVLTSEKILLYKGGVCQEVVTSGSSSIENDELTKKTISIFGPSSDIVMSELSVQGESLYFTTFGESGNWPDKVWRVSLTGVNPVPTEVFGVGSTLSVNGEKVQITNLFEITPAPEGALVVYLATPEGQGIYLINPKTLTAKLVLADTKGQVRLNNNQLVQPRRLYIVNGYVVFYYSYNEIWAMNLETKNLEVVKLIDKSQMVGGFGGVIISYTRLSSYEDDIYLLYEVSGDSYPFTSRVVKWDFQNNTWKTFYNLDEGKQSWKEHSFDSIKRISGPMMGLVKTSSEGWNRPTSFALMQGDFWQEVVNQEKDGFINLSYTFAPGTNNNGFFGAQDQNGYWGLYSVTLTPENPNQPKVMAVTNAANNKVEALTYQSIFTLWGKKLGFYQEVTANKDAPKHNEAIFELGGARVRFLCGNLQFTARLLSNNGNQINGIVPLATQDYQTCDVQVTVNGLSSNKMSVELTDQNITLFEWFPHLNLNDPTKGEGIFTNSFYQLVGPESNNGAVRAKRGETIIGWSTGSGVTDPWLDDSQDASGVTHRWQETPTAYIGGVPVNLEYAVRAPGYNGLDQFGFKVPLGAYGLTPFWFSSDPTKIWWLYIEE